MEHFYQLLLAWAQAHGMKAVFLFMVAENMCIPFPTEVGFVTAQGLINVGAVGFWEAYIVITLGHMLGSGFSYYMGRAGDNAFARRFSHSPRMMRARDKLQRWYDKYGAVTVLFGRLEGHVRPWSSLMAGMAGVRPGPYWLWTLIGSMMYTFMAMGFTKWGWALWMKYPQIRIPALVGMFLVFYGVALYAVLVRFLRRHRRRKQAAAAASPESPSEP
jgi:membrane protein DedA with SNARE-associated domain